MVMVLVMVVVMVLLTMKLIDDDGDDQDDDDDDDGDDDDDDDDYDGDADGGFAFRNPSCTFVFVFFNVLPFCAVKYLLHLYPPGWSNTLRCKICGSQASNDLCGAGLQVLPSWARGSASGLALPGRDMFSLLLCNCFSFFQKI